MGILELGTTPEVRKAFYAVANKIKINEDKKFVYIEPKITVKTRFRNYTKNGYLRTPSFVEFKLN
uniref:Uncharacterized protein n=1 Tax=Anaerobacillus isosaccharinicus TaxID=1532552 RepID=A0A1S2M005_9BACI